MQVISFLLCIKTQIQQDAVKNAVYDNYTITRNPLLSFQDHEHNYFDIDFKGIDLKSFRKIGEKIAQKFYVQQIKVIFRSSVDCLAAMEEKGFSRYEQVEYVDFKYKKGNVKVALLKDKDYILLINRLKKEERSGVSYFMKLIQRVFEIIQEKEGERYEKTV